MLDAAATAPTPSSPSTEERRREDAATADEGAGRGVEHVRTSHTRDDDCRPHVVDGECTVCGVWWVDEPCSCGGHAFHADGCAEAL
jgi:hypothetical protein